jgi:hypothetical protein
MAENKLFNDLIDRAANRRSFVKKLGLAGAALGAAAATSTKGFGQTTFKDSDILNFALNLEYLEAEFYTAATTGGSITAFGVTITGAGSQGPTTGGTQVAFGTNTALGYIAAELASDERAHVTLLQNAITALGGTPVAKPAINLNALGFGFGSVNDFLRAARIFEDIGVTAYAGAAPLLTNPTSIGYAARILAVEALHSGAIRQLVSQANISTFPALDGADHLPPPSGALYFPTDSNGLVELRSPAQVLSLAYGANSASSGGFFPAGINSIFNSSAAATATTDGAYITATPNPITAVGGVGTATITWNAPGASVVQIRVNSAGGRVFSFNGPSGSMTTGAWVTDGTTFFLENASSGDGSPGAVLANLVVHVIP